MLVKRTRGNQVSIPKKILEAAGIGADDVYFDVEYRQGLICLKPVSIEERIPDAAYEQLLAWARAREPGDKAFDSLEGARDYLKRHRPKKGR
jgi:bifunctional DNA-binding transcriptional regulator/antitoxin component of YhaV-PrlF toxin-antitoxin module